MGDFEDKSFKEKKDFYKGRQIFFDAVKAARAGETPIITYKGEQYRLVSPESFWEYVEENRDGYLVIFSKAYKSNTLVYWQYGNKGGFKYCTEKGRLSRSKRRVLCFAERI